MGQPAQRLDLYRTGFTTDINELDVVYGGEKRLFKSIREIIEKYDSPAVCVYQTCVTALGIRVLSCISGDGRYNEIASAHREVCIGCTACSRICPKKCFGPEEALAAAAIDAGEEMPILK